MATANPVDASEDDLLEKMLKEAEVLAARMTSVASGDSSTAARGSSPSTSAGAPSVSGSVRAKEASKGDLDPLIARAELMVQEMKGKSSPSVASVDDLDTTNGSLSAPTREMENVGLSDAAQQQQDEIDEVLRKSEALLDKIRSKASSNAEEEAQVEADADEAANFYMRGTHAPSSVYVLHHTSNSDDVSSVGSASLRTMGLPSKSDPQHLADALNTSRFMADALKEMYSPANTDSSKFDCRISPETPVPAAPDDEVAVMDYTSVSVSSSTQAKRIIQAKLQSEIPDFTVTPPDAKWEKVKSAAPGDDDYASIHDYTSEPVTSRPIRAKPMAMPLKQSRLSTYRGQARRDRLRKQRMLLWSGLVAAVVLYFCFLRSGVTQPSNNSGSQTGAFVQETNDNNSTLESLDAQESIIDPKDLHLLDNVELGDVELENDSFSDFEDPLKEGHSNELDDSEVDHDSELTELHDQEDSLAIVGKEATTAVELKHGSHTDEETLAKDNKPKCKNPLSKIFKKRCRVLAREQRRLAKAQAQTAKEAH